MIARKRCRRVVIVLVMQKRRLLRSLPAARARGTLIVCESADLGAPLNGRRPYLFIFSGVSYVCVCVFGGVFFFSLHTRFCL